MPIESHHAIVFVLSAPSGGGKTTLLERLRAFNDFVYSISCTTRKPREKEVEGRDYFFVSDNDFDHHVSAGDFLEHAGVHGARYGTLRQTVVDNLVAGRDVLLDVDVQGAVTIRQNAPQEIRASLVDVFLMPPSKKELRRRLSQRRTESSEQIEVRLENAVAEMAEWKSYRYTIISGTPEEDVEAFRAIMQAERLRTDRRIRHE